MRRSKKLIIAVVLAAVILAGSIGGVVLANGNGDDDGPAAKFGAFIDKVIANYEGKGYTIESPEALKEAFAEAGAEAAKNRMETRAAAMEDRPKMGPEAMQERLDRMVEEGVMTEEQAAELQEWLNDMPEGIPFGPGLPGHGRFPGRVPRR
jgi:stalled ribosome rescue protein Dom34